MSFFGGKLGHFMFYSYFNFLLSTKEEIITQWNYNFLSVCLKVEKLPANYFRKIAEKLSFQKIPVEF